MLRSRRDPCTVLEAKEGGELLDTIHALSAELPNAYGDIEQQTARPSELAHRSTTRHAGRWPIVVRIPDLSSLRQSSLETGRSSHSSAHSIDYRFDPPDKPSREAALVDRARMIRRAEPSSSAPLNPQLVSPHAERQPAYPPARHQLRGSRILPQSDLFSAPGASLHEQVAPLLRFLIMVALFTLAGTSVLMMYNRGEADRDLLPAHTAARKSATTSAAGPIAHTSPRLTPAAPIAADPKLPIEHEPWRELADESPPPTESAVDTAPSFPQSESPYPTTDFPTTQSATDLPRVQTSDDAASVARFTGQIQEAPTRHAQHDNQQSVH